jgi:5'-nucleotidase
VNDKILGDKFISEKVNEFKKLIDESILKPLNVSFSQPTAKIEAVATRDYTEHALGHLLASSFQRAAQSDIGFCPDGMIRDDIFVGKTGIQSFSDIFRLMPLGVGETNEEVGYPIIKVHVNGRELKSIIETMLIAYKFKGSTYFPRFTGIEITFNPYRMILDRVSEAHLKKPDGSIEVIDFNDEKRLYSIGTLSYVGKFFWIIPDVSFGLFNVTPKFADGSPILYIKDSLASNDPSKSGVHEYKAWKALLDYIRTLPIDPESKLPLIPTSGEVLNSAVTMDASLAPSSLFKNATWIQWTASSIGLFAVLLLLGSARWLLKRKGRRY